MTKLRKRKVEKARAVLSARSIVQKHQKRASLMWYFVCITSYYVVNGMWLDNLSPGLPTHLHCFSVCDHDKVWCVHAWEASHVLFNSVNHVMHYVLGNSGWRASKLSTVVERMRMNWMLKIYRSWNSTCMMAPFLITSQHALKAWQCWHCPWCQKCKCGLPPMCVPTQQETSAIVEDCDVSGLSLNADCNCSIAASNGWSAPEVMLVAYAVNFRPSLSWWCM